MKRKKAKQLKVPVISPQGNIDTNIVMLLRIGYAVAVAVVLITLANLLGQAAAHQSMPAHFWVMLIIGLLAAPACAFAEISFGGLAARREEKRIRHKLLAHAFALGTSFNRTSQADSGQLIAMLTDNAERLTEFKQAYLGATKAAIVIPFVTLAYVAIAIDWLTGLLLVIFCPLIPLAVVGFMRLFAGSSANSRKQRGKLAGKYLDALRNLVTIRLLGAGSRVEQQLRVEGERNRLAIMRLLAGNQIVIIVLDGMFSLVMVCTTVTLTVLRHQAGVITVAEAAAVIMLMLLLLEPLNQVAGFFYVGMGGMASQKAIGRYLANNPVQIAKDAASEASDFAAEPMANGEVVSPDQYAILANGLHFDYGRGPVLRGVELAVKPGTKCGLVGRSGGGKSTLLGVLRRELIIQQGKLWVSGKPVTADASMSEVDWLRNQIAFVAQRTWLFTGTIRDNLLIAKADANDDQLWAALEKAHLADEVRKMAGGLDAPVGEQGSLISGGQAQRLSLARAFLSGRPILMLDEPTSQVDIASEAEIISAIADIDQSVTVLLVTHRKALLTLCDQVFELAEGQLSPYSPTADYVEAEAGQEC